MASDLRVVSYNVFVNTIFPEVDSVQAEKFARVVQALDADIVNLQEIKNSAAEVAALFDSIAPLAEGTWHAHRGGRETVIVSKYPLSMLETSIDPMSTRPPALALVDLPDTQFERDFYVINHHYVAGSSTDLREQRMRNSDATIRWLFDARTPGGSIDLPPGTPLAVVGDLNNSPPSVTNTLSTLVTGNITNVHIYGPSSPPDWDGTSFTETMPLINGVGPDNYTLRNTNGSVRIDHILYSDSALDEANKFVLNTVDMSPAELSATGLQAFDVTIDSIGEVFDHLPVVADFRLFNFGAGDFNFDRLVDHADLALWESSFGLGIGADADRDGDTDGADFLAWQQSASSENAALAAIAISVPEPSAMALAIMLVLIMAAVASQRRILTRLLVLTLLLSSGVGQCLAQTGTFIDRQLPTDLRVVSFNIYLNTIFPDVRPTQAAKFVRVVDALDPDILNLQEIHKSAAAVVELLNTIAPLAEGSWHAHKSRGNVIASKYPLSMLATSIDAHSNRPPAIALVDLPDGQFARDFYILSQHYICCGVPGSPTGPDLARQRASDATVRWLRDARSPGGPVDLPPGTPIAIVGDLNNIGGPGPLNTLITGDILNETVYGPDSPPDWDNGPFAEARPLHNGSGPADYTYRNAGSHYDLTRIEHILYSDSALDIANKFVLNTVDMSPAELAATGLETFDITIDSEGVQFDHLPVVADFRLFNFAAADFNFDRVVDQADVAQWESHFGQGSGADSDLDGDTDGADFAAWQRHLTPHGATPMNVLQSVPESIASLQIVLLVLTTTACFRKSPFLARAE